MASVTVLNPTPCSARPGTGRIRDLDLAVHLPNGGHPALVVQERDLTGHEPRLPQDLPEWHHHVPRLDVPRRRLRQERLVLHEVLRVDHRELVSPPPEPPLHPPRNERPGVPPTHDQDPHRTSLNEQSWHRLPPEEQIGTAVAEQLVRRWAFPRSDRTSRPASTTRRAGRYGDRPSSRASAAGRSASVVMAASGTASCSAVGCCGASPRRIQTVRMPVALAGSMS